MFTIAIAAIMADLTAFSTSGGTEIAIITLVAVVAVALFVHPGAPLARADDLARRSGAGGRSPRSTGLAARAAW